jgi:hypothetical protein
MRSLCWACLQLVNVGITPITVFMNLIIFRNDLHLRAMFQAMMSSSTNFEAEGRRDCQGDGALEVWLGCRNTQHNSDTRFNKFNCDTQHNNTQEDIMLISLF